MWLMSGHLDNNGMNWADVISTWQQGHHDGADVKSPWQPEQLRGSGAAGAIVITF